MQTLPRIALGMSLAAYGIKGQLPTLAAICLMKLLLLPAAVLALAAGPLAGLPPVWMSVAVLFAAPVVALSACSPPGQVPSDTPGTTPSIWTGSPSPTAASTSRGVSRSTPTATSS